MKIPKSLAKQIEQAAGIKSTSPAEWNGSVLTPEGRKRKRESIERSQIGRTLEQALFDKLCIAHGLPVPDHEYIFAPWTGGTDRCLHIKGEYTCKSCGATRRRWRFDYLFAGWLAVERQGGNFAQGRHSNPAELRKEYEKLNHAVLEGFSVLLFLPEQFDSGEAFEFINEVLKGEA